MKICYFFLLMIHVFALAAAPQDSTKALLTGQIRPADVLLPAGIFEVSIPRLKRYVLTDAEGRFALPGLPFGNYIFIVRGAAQHHDTFRIAIDMDTTSLGILPVTGKGMFADEAILYDADVVPDLVAEQEQWMPVWLARSAFDRAIQAWGPLGYRYRGYNRSQSFSYLNGLGIADMETGITPRVLWAGMRGTVMTAVAEEDAGPTLIAVPAPGQVFAFEATAVAKPRQISTTYGHSNGTWSNTMGLSYSTGDVKGWALSLSAGYCWSEQGYVPGTFYREFSGYLSLSRSLSKHSALQLTALVMPVSSGLGAATTQEAMDLAGSPYYNPNWGYQNGKIRNARLSRENTPILMLYYEYKPDTTLLFHIAAACRAGYSGVSALDWYDAPDPRPDYYKNMPSAYKDDTATAEKIRAAWLNNPEQRQLDWNKMYAANRVTVDSLTPQRAAYVLGEDRADVHQYSISAYVHKQYKQYNLQAGVTYDRQRTEHYRNMLDLLGGGYFVDVNQFAEQAYAGSTTFNQNDLNHPDRKVYTGDRYSYHYRANQTRATAWGRLGLAYKRLQFFIAGHMAYNAAQREGLYRTGLFPEDSYGKSVLQQFYTFRGSAGIRYTQQKKHNLFLQTDAGTTPPAFNDLFVAPRNRNTGSEASASRYVSADAGYRLYTQRLQGSITFFTTHRDRLTEIRRFYHEDYRSFVNYVMNGVSIKHSGVELALTLRVTSFLAVTAAACNMQVVYRSRPEVIIYKDNDTSSRVDHHLAYLKDYNLPGPGALYLLAFDFRLPRYVRAGIRWRRTDHNYTDINPARRTDAAVGLTVPGSIEQQRILQQERIPAAYMIDLSAGKTCYFRRAGKGSLHRPLALFLRAGISNLLNNKNAVAGAYEQLRFDFGGLDPDRFPNKYSYARGAVYTFSISLQL